MTLSRPVAGRRVLLLNPPGRSNVLREYFCCKTAKAYYLVPPVDLIQMSGTLDRIAEVKVLDCVCDGVAFESAVNHICALSPAVIVSLAGSMTWEQDIAFYKRLKEENPDLLIGVTGDIAVGAPNILLEDNEVLDAVITNFFSEDVARFVQGNLENSFDVVTRNHSRTQISPARSQPLPSEVRIPIPRHDLFQNRGYRYPFCRHRRFAAVLTDFGCPFRCNYCLHGTLPYIQRAVDNVIDEISLVTKLGIREVYFADQTFGADIAKCRDLCKWLERYEIQWVAFSRADVLLNGLIPVIARGGCHTVIIGIESADETIRAKSGKRISNDQIRSAVQECHNVGMRVAATFILGLPGETRESMEEMLTFAVSLGLDFCSWNVLVPKVPTPLWKRFSKEMRTAPTIGDPSCFPPISFTPDFNREQLATFRSRIERAFYGRPSYILKRVFDMRTCWDVECALVTAFNIMRGYRRREDQE